MTRRPTLLVACAMTLAALAGLGWLADRRASAHPPPPPAKVEYSLLAWERADTLAVLRTVTGDDVAGPREMVRKLAAGTIEPVDNPKLQAAIDQRLQEKLIKVGAQGWEAFWVRNTTTVLEGHVLPAPAVLLKRRP